VARLPQAGTVGALSRSAGLGDERARNQGRLNALCVAVVSSHGRRACLGGRRADARGAQPWPPARLPGGCGPDPAGARSGGPPIGSSSRQAGSLVSCVEQPRGRTEDRLDTLPCVFQPAAPAGPATTDHESLEEKRSDAVSLACNHCGEDASGDRSVAASFQARRLSRLVHCSGGPAVRRRSRSCSKEQSAPSACRCSSSPEAVSGQRGRHGSSGSTRWRAGTSRPGGRRGLTSR
jgi:hypothetical protein